MKIEYSKEADALYVHFREVYVAKSKEIEEGVVIDFDQNGHIIGIEILDVSERLMPQDLANISFESIPIEGSL
jgi:uncharacterized protein YuzE